MIVGHPICLESLFSVGTEAAIICSITAQDCGKLKPETHPELSSFDLVDCSGVYVASAKHTLTLACTQTQTHTLGNCTLLLTSMPIHKKKLQRQIRYSV